MRRDDDVVLVPIPRAALTIVAAPPMTVSQRTCDAVLGLDKRAYLRLVGEFRRSGGAVHDVGNLRLVELAELKAWLAARARGLAAPEVGDSSRTAVSDDPTSDVSALERSLGVRRA
jgi:hypothetical protein